MLAPGARLLRPGKDARAVFDNSIGEEGERASANGALGFWRADTAGERPAAPREKDGDYTVTRYQERTGRRANRGAT